MKKGFESPTLERIETAEGTSLSVRQFSEEARNTRPYWHYHPELELVYVNGGNGKRHVGSHLSYFTDGELVLIGSNLPHQGFTNRLNNYRSETVVQMLPNFLGDHFFSIGEMKCINDLFIRAKRGLSFSGLTKDQVGAKLESLVELDSFFRLTKTLEILRDLAKSTEYQTLNAPEFSLEVQPQDNDRLNIVLNHIRQNFQSPISLTTITDLIGMTEPSFSRYFKNVTGKTFTKFVNDYRLVHASKLLAEKQISILDVCYESGFINYSHFTKKFKEFSGKSPSKYRGGILQVVE